MVEEGGAAKLMALLKAGPNHPATPHAARALQSLACRHPGAQVTDLRNDCYMRSFLLNWCCRKHETPLSTVCCMPETPSKQCFKESGACNASHHSSRQMHLPWKVHLHSALWRHS